MYLGDPLSTLALIVGQASPGDPGTWLTSLGTAGITAGVLWLIYQRAEARHEREILALVTELGAARADNKSLTSRLFLLADRGMAVGQTASEVAKGDTTDPRVLLVLERLEAQLDARGDR